MLCLTHRRSRANSHLPASEPIAQSACRVYLHVPRRPIRQIIPLNLPILPLPIRAFLIFAVIHSRLYRGQVHKSVVSTVARDVVTVAVDGRSQRWGSGQGVDERDGKMLLSAEKAS